MKYAWSYTTTPHNLSGVIHIRSFPWVSSGHYRGGILKYATGTPSISLTTHDSWSSSHFIWHWITYVVETVSDQTLRSKGWHAWLVLGKPRVKMASSRPDLLVGILRGFPQFCGKITGLCLENRSKPLRSTLFEIYKFCSSVQLKLSTYKTHCPLNSVMK
jgi:hypothetical protein